MQTVLLIANIWHILIGTVMFLVALFLILLVLVQRGRGGGLAGALGGLGGQSAFGTRAGDTFTYITIWASAAWILLCIGATKFLGTQPGKLGAEESLLPSTTVTQPGDEPSASTSPPLTGNTGSGTPRGANPDAPSEVNNDREISDLGATPTGPGPAAPDGTPELALPIGPDGTQTPAEPDTEGSGATPK
jgi:preprotein translocase subunit SecG